MTYQEDRNRELNEIEETSISSFLGPMAAGLGAISLGALILRKGSRSYIADALTLLGHPNRSGLTKNIDELANVGRARPRSGVGARSVESMVYDVRKDVIRTGPIDLIDDLNNTIDIIGAVDSSVADHISAKVKEFVHREHTAAGVYSSFFGRDLKRLTVDDVLSNQRAWKNVLGDDKIKTLKKARGFGLVDKDTFLDKNLYVNKKGQLRDTRLSSVFYVDPAGKNSSLFGKLTGGVNFFGQASVFKSILGAKTNVAVLDPLVLKGAKESVNAPRFFVAGEVFTYGKDGTPVLLGKNRKLRFRGDPLEQVTGAREGRTKIDPRRIVKYYNALPGPTGPKKALRSIEAKLGVGFSFANRLPLYQRWILGPLLRMRALGSGEGVVYKHAYRMQHQFSKIADAALGAEYPELIAKHGIPEAVEGGGKAVDYRKLGFWQRLGIVFDTATDYSVIKRTSYEEKLAKPSRKLTNLDLIIPIPETALKTSTGIFPRKFAQKIGDLETHTVTKVGDDIKKYQSRYYDVAGSKMLGGRLTPMRDVANYMFYRINTLASESLLGLGLAPANNVFGTMARLAAIPVAYETARQTLDYGNYLIEDLTGYSPLKLAADLYAGGRLLQQNIRSALGIQQTARELEENYPGSIDSEGFSMMRSLAGPLAGTSLGLKAGKPGWGLLAGALSYFLIGGPGLGQTAEELEKEYSGQTKVPVRKGAWWSLGYQGLFGERPKYFDYSWYHKLQNDASTVGMYGSTDEYFKYHQNIFGIPFPNFHNMLGLNYIANPYRFEEQNYDSRPYIATGSNLEQFPIFGPALAFMFGKPTRYRTPDELPLLRANVVDRGLDPGTARLLGIPEMSASAIQMEDPNDPMARLRKLGDVALEPMGIYKFALNFFGVDLEPGPNRLATSNLVTSVGRGYYQMNLGGAFGQSEFIRRFMLTEYSSSYALSQLYNPIPNNMPDFLPGTRSQNMRDQSYFIDFHTGDAMAKIERGEYRLPGAGYENLNKLHSGKPGVYDDVDKFLILSDVAPWADATRKLEYKMKYMPLSPEWREKVDDAIRQKKEMVSVDNRYPRYYDKSLNDLANINEAIQDGQLYKTTRGIYDFITHDVLTEIPYVGAKLFPFRSPYEQYRKLYVEGAEYADWNAPYEGIIRPAFYDMYYEDPITATAKGLFLGGLISGPMRYFMPIKGVQAGANATSLGMFEINARTSLALGAIGFGASTTRLSLGESQDSIPSFRQQESEFTEYMDMFKFLKFGVLQQEALEQGNTQAAGSYRKQQMKTLVGATNPIMLKASLPTSADKRFFDYALNEAPSAERERILAGTPGYFSNALQTAYSRDYPSKDQITEKVSAYFQNNPVPALDSIMWHPSIPTDAAKYKLINYGLNGISSNMHRYGFYESHKNEIENRYPYLLTETVRFDSVPNYNSYTTLVNTLRSQINYGSNYSSAFGVSNNFTQTLDRSSEVTYYANDYMRAR